jgi:hypothetical protein
MVADDVVGHVTLYIGTLPVYFEGTEQRDDAKTCLSSVASQLHFMFLSTSNAT